jgi:response regulator of citrate/malate metabolism
MDSKKQSRADLQGKKIDALIRVVQQILEENDYLKGMATGTLQLVKRMPDYEEALAKMTEELEAEEKAKVDGLITQEKKLEL